jgi:hypothetical protein
LTPARMLMALVENTMRATINMSVGGSSHTRSQW